MRRQSVVHFMAKACASSGIRKPSFKFDEEEASCSTEARAPKPNRRLAAESEASCCVRAPQAEELPRRGPKKRLFAPWAEGVRVLRSLAWSKRMPPIRRGCPSGGAFCTWPKEALSASWSEEDVGARSCDAVRRFSHRSCAEATGYGLAGSSRRRLSRHGLLRAWAEGQVAEASAAAEDHVSWAKFGEAALLLAEGLPSVQHEVCGVRGF